MAELLIVDDDEDLADLLGEILSADGHHFRVAHNGREGLELVSQQRPDLVLLDVDMPVLRGPEMAYELFLRNCGDEQIPVALLSGTVGLSAVATSVGTPYFLAKPYTLGSVRRLLARALEERISPHVKAEPAP